MSSELGIGFFVGFVVALPASMLSVLLVAMWQRRQRPVAIAAFVVRLAA
jgi:glucan phosphoethanolaminetransferase (alkaline phosphatase superfamily)